MSHYTVAVITKTDPRETCELEQLLVPFDESLEVDRYVYRTREQIIEDAKMRKEDWETRIRQMDKVEDLKQYLLNPDYRMVLKYFTAETDDDFYYADVCPEMVYPGSDDEYTTYNPDSKWDWYQIGGRWSGSLRDFNGEYHDTLKLSDWDYNYIDAESVTHYQRFWEVAVEGAEPTEEEKENFFTFWKPQYYLEKYGNKSNYVKSMLTFSTYALLTPDGEWLEPGRMGWFGMSGADPEDEGKWERDFTSLIDTFDKEYYITIVDCHI